MILLPSYVFIKSIYKNYQNDNQKNQSIFVNLTVIDTMEEDKMKLLFNDIGKSTMRGIRKCPKCGTYNGTRGHSCKNKSCNAIFKEGGNKKKTISVAKLQTGTTTQIFSVRVWDKGPDHRGFVQLPLQGDSNFFSQVSALCFVDSCQRLFNINILKCHEKNAINSPSTCSHIQLAMRCSYDAQPLRIENEAIQSLDIPDEIKENIYELSNETPGPLVQRVTKNIMAVKCKVTTKHPLGYLHVTFLICNMFKENQYFCSCMKGKNVDKNCVHYYSCIAAFLSDAKLTEEFSHYITREKPNETFTIEISEEDDRNPLVAILNNSINQDEVPVEVKDLLLPDISQEFDRFSSVVDVEQNLDEDFDQHDLESIIKPQEEKKKKSKKKKKNISKKYPCRKRVRKDLPKEILVEVESTNESKTTLSFIEWLASVTERINQSMHYQFDGKPEPLVFHAPHDFFECLISRFVSTTVGSKRKRLPNFVTTFTRKNATPLGTFHNYTWQITNILHAKAIFDTPLMPLNIQRSFIQKCDGSYEDLDPKDIEEGLPRMEGQSAIRPIECKTFLKIGNVSHDQTEPSVLSIDWTPNVLPISKIGELKITFEYGHSKHPS